MMAGSHSNFPIILRLFLKSKHESKYQTKDVNFDYLFFFNLIGAIDAAQPCATALIAGERISHPVSHVPVHVRQGRANQSRTTVKPDPCQLQSSIGLSATTLKLLFLSAGFNIETCK